MGGGRGAAGCRSRDGPCSAPSLEALDRSSGQIGYLGRSGHAACNWSDGSIVTVVDEVALHLIGRIGLEHEAGI